MSNDGASFTQVFANTGLICRTASEELNIAWSYPACKLSAVFPPVTARYVRVSFDDTTLFGGLHEWISEVEVFASSGNPPMTPVLTVTPSSPSITTVQPLTVAISVTASGGRSTGSVTLSSGGYSSGATALSGGNASIVIPAGSLVLGANTLTATYTPDSSSSSTYNGATGTATVNVAATAAAMTVAATVNPGALGGTDPITATVTGVAGAAAPTGSVSFYSGSTLLSTAALSGGVATYTYTLQQTGSYTITANYSGDANYSAATASYTGSVYQAAAMSTPTPGSTLTGASVTFAWTKGTNVTENWLYIGTTGAGSNQPLQQLRLYHLRQCDRPAAAGTDGVRPATLQDKRRLAV